MLDAPTSSFGQVSGTASGLSKSLNRHTPSSERLFELSFEFIALTSSLQLFIGLCEGKRLKEVTSCVCQNFV